MNRRTIFAMLTGAALMLVVGGAVALLIGRAHAHGTDGAHAGIMKRMISAKLDEALTQANVSAEQRAAIYASRDRAFAAFEANRPERGAQRDQVLALFEGERLDVAQLQAVHSGMEQRHQAIHDAVAQAVVEIHDTLTPEQRRIVANYARQFRPGGMH